MVPDPLLNDCTRQESVNPYRSGFLKLDTTDILDWIILCGGDHPVHHGIFSSVFGLYSQE